MAKIAKNQKTIHVFWTDLQTDHFLMKYIQYGYYMLNPLLSVFDIFDKTTSFIISLPGFKIPTGPLLCVYVSMGVCK